MLTIALIFLFYVLLTVVSINSLLSLPVPLFLGIIYLVPIVVNSLTTILQKENKKKLLYSLLSPAAAFLFYISFAFFTMKSGVWLEFVQANTVSTADMSVDVAENLLSIEQILFAVLAYLSPSAVCYFFSRTSQLNTNKGVTYA
jgi:hypothetical protein